MDAGKKGTSKGAEDAPQDQTEEAKKPSERLNRKSLLKKAYLSLARKLEAGDSEAIGDLVKLIKAEKDLGGEKQDVKEIKVRWEPGEDESSSEK